MIENEKLVALDIETSNSRGKGALEPRDEGSVIALVQTKEENGEIQLHDWNKETEALIQRYIDEGYRFLIHNAFFELDWFLVQTNLPIHKMKVWCTMIGSQILNAGKMIPDEATWFANTNEKKNMEHVGTWTPLISEEYDNIEDVKGGKFRHNLQATMYRYADGAKIEKDQGTTNWLQRPLTPEQIRYAKDDVRYLHKAVENQWKFVKRFGLEKIANLEMNIIAATVDMKDKGIKLDLDKWKVLAAEYAEDADRLEKELNHKMGLELAERENMPSLFSKTIPKAFKVSSNVQVARFFGVENATEQALRNLDHPFIRDVLRYKENAKIASTYGDSYLQYIHDDGRIHSMLVQAETATGRYSSRKPNLQNVPRDMLKGFLVAGENALLLTVDYSAVESRILAYVSGDDNYVKSVNSSDVHWENAKKIFGLSENANLTDHFHVEQFGKTFSGSDLRSMSKGVSFGIPYGISAVGLVNRGFAENADQGQDLIDGFNGQYPNVAKMLRRAVMEGLGKGYTQDPMGRIRWYEKPEPNKVTEEEMRIIEGAIARRSQNHKIQSMSANITKMAIQDLYQYLSETGYGRMVLTIHDSIFFEVFRGPHTNEAVKNILDIMEAAGPKVFPGMPTPVDADVGHKEKRKCKITNLPFSVYSHIWNEEENRVEENPAWIEPRIYKLLKFRGVDTEDLQGSFVALVDILEVQPVEWKQENSDIVEAVQERMALPI